MSQRITIAGEPAFQEIGQCIAAILQSRIHERCPAGPARVTLTLAQDETIPAEGFRLVDGPAGLRLSAPDHLGLLAGAGKLLRTSQYGAAGFLPGQWRGLAVPDCPVRGIYFASHFHNWYQAAPEAEINRYVEDLALWGVNAVGAVFPFIDLNGWEDPEAAGALAQVRRLFRAAKRLGLGTCLFTGNTLFANTPAALRAVPVNDPLGRRGNTGAPVCPNHPVADAWLHDCHRRLLAGLADIGLDYLCVWPYDEGGCSCASCAPWGANGFLKVARELAELARERFPGVRIILSTWMFDTPPEGEWEGLTRALARGGHGLDYIMAASHEDYPRYPLEQGVPGELPLLDFPEISMWGLSPWGGFGATPLPARHERIWQQAKEHLAGGFAYSEGIFEDLNKVVVSQLWWDRQAGAREAVAEYLRYEYGPDVVEPAQRLISLIEDSHTRAAGKQPVQPERVREALALAGEVDGLLPSSARFGWRWRILYLRAVLDHERYLGGSLETPRARAALRELIQIFHARPVDDGSDPYHGRVRPPLTNP